MHCLYSTDQLAISVVPREVVFGKGTTANFTAMATGVSTNESNFVYQWGKRSRSNFPSKVLGVYSEVLTIPNALESDEGQYYCNVTNEWGRSMESNGVILTIYGKSNIYNLL